MQKVSAKRQVTLPQALCDELGIKPGDFIEFFEDCSEITLFKKEQVSAKEACSIWRRKPILVMRNQCFRANRRSLYQCTGMPALDRFVDVNKTIVP